MKPDALLYGLVLLTLTVAISPVLPITESRATLAVEPTDGNWEADQYIAADPLSTECQQLAHKLAAGNTVSETGYRFIVVDTEVLIKKTNVGGDWRRGDTFCLKHLTERNRVRIEGQVYEMTAYSFHEGRLSWLETGWVLGLMTSILLCLLGISERRDW